jgi:hypothetical protein
MSRAVLTFQLQPAGAVIEAGPPCGLGVSSAFKNLRPGAGGKLRAQEQLF